MWENVVGFWCSRLQERVFMRGLRPSLIQGNWHLLIEVDDWRLLEDIYID